MTNFAGALGASSSPLGAEREFVDRVGLHVEEMPLAPLRNTRNPVKSTRFPQFSPGPGGTRASPEGPSHGAASARRPLVLAPGSFLGQARGKTPTGPRPPPRGEPAHPSPEIAKWLSYEAIPKLSLARPEPVSLAPLRTQFWHSARIPNRRAATSHPRKAFVNRVPAHNE